MFTTTEQTKWKLLSLTFHPRQEIPIYLSCPKKNLSNEITKQQRYIHHVVLHPSSSLEECLERKEAGEAWFLFISVRSHTQCCGWQRLLQDASFFMLLMLFHNCQGCLGLSIGISSSVCMNLHKYIDLTSL